MNCPRCGKENPDDVQLCQSCSYVLTQSTVTKEDINIKTSWMGIASMVLGILSLFTLGITAIPAIILGIISLVQIEKSGGRLTGRAFGIVGIAVPVVVCCLIGVLMPVLNKVHELGRRETCAVNLRELVIAWIIYADDNDGKLVNGQPCVNANGTLDPADDRPTTNKRVEIPWTRGIEIDPATGDPKISKHDQEQLIKNGALWPYSKNTAFYRCPTGKANHMRTYSIVCSLNGDSSPVDSLSNKELLCVKNRSLVRKPPNRILFVCEGWVNNLSFRVGYSNPEAWIDPPPMRHSGGMFCFFADGHRGYWKWKGKGTLEAGKKRQFNYTPQSPEDREDLRDMRMAVWGEIP